MYITRRTSAKARSATASSLTDLAAPETLLLPLLLLPPAPASVCAAGAGVARRLCSKKTKPRGGERRRAKGRVSGASLCVTLWPTACFKVWGWWGKRVVIDG